jgi:hypothetical protein
MNRNWLKYLLPIFAWSLTAGLLFAGHHQERAIEAWGGYSAWDGPPPSAYEIAFALNLPAMLLATPGALLLGWTGILDRATLARWQEVLLAAYFSLFVVAQWAFVGRWLSQPRKSIRSPGKNFGLSLFIHSLGILVSLCIAWFGVVNVKHSGWMSSWIRGAGMIAWSVIITAFLTARIRRLLGSRGRPYRI